MEFHKYSSITRLDDKSGLESALLYYNNCDYVLTEKVHGANFKFTTDGVDIYPGNRSQYIGAGFNFYGCNALVDKYREAVIQTYRNLVTRNLVEAGDYIDICGEIFGGNYFGVSAPDSPMVQRKSCYLPTVDVVIFDIFVHATGYLDWMTVRSNLNDGFKIVPVIAYGPLESLMEYSNEFKTTIPELFGMEPDDRENWAEGWTLRPLQEQNFRTGRRVIFKSVSGKVKGSPRPSRAKGAVHLEGVDKELFDEFYENITDYRIDQVLSKFGPATVDNTHVITKLLVQDIVADFKEKYSFKIQKQNFWIVGKRAINKSAVGAVMDYLLEGKNETSCDG